MFYSRRLLKYFDCKPRPVCIGACIVAQVADFRDTRRRPNGEATVVVGWGVKSGYCIKEGSMVHKIGRQNWPKTSLYVGIVGHTAYKIRTDR